MAATILFSLFGALLFLGSPIVVALGVASMAVYVVSGDDITSLVELAFSAINSFPLMALPSFILAGALMGDAGIARRLIRIAEELAGPAAGGLGAAAVMACMFFGAISGSGPATTAAVGMLVIPAMIERGYGRSYPAAITATAGGLGVVIPPSMPLVIYGVTANESISALFMAGVIPGLLLAGGSLAANGWVSWKRDYRSDEARPERAQMWRNSLMALPALGLIVLIVGGIRGGIFTPTEASVIAVFYALFCGFFVYRALRLRDLPGLILRAALISSAVLLILGAARAFAWVLVIEGVPQFLAETIIAWELSPILFLLAVNVLLLLFGLFMDPLPGVMILVPILAPISHALGIAPDHFAIVVIVNLTLGLTTPPVGSLIFVVSSAVNLKPAALIREMPPFFLANFVVLMLLTFVPALSTWLPSISGF